MLGNLNYSVTFEISDIQLFNNAGKMHIYAGKIYILFAI